MWLVSVVECPCLETHDNKMDLSDPQKRTVSSVVKVLTSPLLSYLIKRNEISPSLNVSFLSCSRYSGRQVSIIVESDFYTSTNGSHFFPREENDSLFDTNSDKDLN